MGVITNPFERADIWSRPLEPYQHAVAETIASMMPTHAKSFLDVGCGNGAVSSVIHGRTGVPVTGVDSSVTAIQMSCIPSEVADITALPMADSSVDIVISTDVFEHLPTSDFSTAVEEVFRVANLGVAICVPNQEDLLLGTAWCDNCAAPFHVNGHLRTFGWKDLARLAPAGWSLEAVAFTGERWSGPNPPETSYRRLGLHEWGDGSDSGCPICGLAPPPPGLPSTISATASREIWHESIRYSKTCGRAREFSEVCVFFKRQSSARDTFWGNGLRLTEEGPLVLDVLQSSNVEVMGSWSASLTLSNRSTNEISTEMRPDLNASSFPSTAKIVAGATGGYVLQFPIDSQTSGIQIKGCFPDHDIVVRDELGLVRRIHASPKGRVDISFELDRPLEPTIYGLLIDVPPGASDVAAQILPRGPELLVVTPKEGMSGFLSFKFKNIPFFFYVHEQVSLDIKQYLWTDGHDS